MQTFPLKPRINNAANVLIVLPAELGLATNSYGLSLRDPQNMSGYSFPSSHTSKVDLPAKQAPYKSGSPLPVFCDSNGSKGEPK
jgi:hypothetical protein